MESQLLDVQRQMQQAVEIFFADLSSIRTGRATPSLVENIVIASYGGTQRLKVMELGTVSTLDPRTIVIQPWDQSVIADIAKGILEANLGITPVVDGVVIRISFPPLSEERRQELVKLLKQKLEMGKVMIRQVRHDKMSEIKRLSEEGEISEDDRRRIEEELQRLTDEFTSEIEVSGKKKEEDIMQI